MHVVCQDPERRWLFHVSCCPRCLIILARGAKNHCFIEEGINPYYTDLFKVIFSLKIKQKRNELVISKRENNYAKKYMEIWYPLRNAWMMLYQYTGSNLNSDNLLHSAEKLDFYINSIIQYLKTINDLRDYFLINHIVSNIPEQNGYFAKSCRRILTYFT